MKKFGIGLLVTGALVALGFHYWELRWKIQVANFRNEIYESEHRILRDEIDELARRRTYEQGCMDTMIKAELSSGFSDGLKHALAAIPKEGYIDGYHSATSDGWAGAYYQQLTSKKAIEDAKKSAFISGRQSGYEDATKDAADMKSHDDFSPRQRLQRELETKSPFKTVENNDE